MARIHVTCVADRSGIPEDPQRRASLILRAAAEADRHKRHKQVESPESADLILFAEMHGDDDAACGPYFETVRRDPVYLRFREKCVVISGMDRIVPLVPGIFASVEKRWHRGPIALPGPYLVDPNPFLVFKPLDEMPGEAAWLASFVGCAQQVPVRQRLMAIRDLGFHIKDNSESFVGAIRSGQDDRLAELKRNYVDVSLASRFILCPRGAGASSFRLFEAMEMGRAPVVLSDDWVAPSGPKWEDFLVRTPEREVGRLPSILEARADDAVAMGAAARRAWEDNFGPNSLFNWFAGEALRIREASSLSKDVACSLARLQFLRPFHLRRNWRWMKVRGLRSLSLQA